MGRGNLSKPKADERLKFFTNELEPMGKNSYQWSTLFLARIATLRALEVYVPKVLEELRQMQLNYKDEASMLWEIISDNEFRYEAPQVLPWFPSCSRALTDLMFRYNLGSSKHHWMLYVLSSYLCMYVGSEMAHRAFKVAVIPARTAYENDVGHENFEFRAMPWNPLVETRINYEKRLQSLFQTLLRKHLEHLDREVRKKITPSYEPQGLRKGIVPTDAVRLIQYQVLEMSYDQIVDLESTTREEAFSYQAVYDGIKRFANLIGIELRSHKRD